MMDVVARTPRPRVKRKAAAGRVVILFFDEKETCWNACDILGVSRRKCTGLDRLHGGDYSRTTHHYALRYEGGQTVTRNIRYKLIIDDGSFDALPVERRPELCFVDSSIDWVV